MRAPLGAAPARVPVVHDLKIWPEPFQAIVDGRKTAEFRRERGDARGQVDRLFGVGDELLLREWDPEKEHHLTGCRVGGYTGRQHRAVITHRLGSLFEDVFGIPAGYVMLSIRPVDDVVHTLLQERRDRAKRLLNENDGNRPIAMAVSAIAAAQIDLIDEFANTYNILTARRAETTAERVRVEASW